MRLGGLAPEQPAEATELFAEVASAQAGQLFGILLEKAEDGVHSLFGGCLIEPGSLFKDVYELFVRVMPSAWAGLVDPDEVVADK